MNLKIENSLKIMKGLYDTRKENIIAFSGGKDSIVLWHLAQLSGLEFSYVYTNTTIDPPGHLRFIRENYPNVQIINPRYSFYKVVEKYGLPTRVNRFCCQHLKEYVGKGAKVFEGLRIDESKDEEERISKRGKKKNLTKRGRRLDALKEPEQCDTRIKGKIHVYPIINWTTKNVWEYIKLNNLPYPQWYDMGFHRLGCIGCPLNSKRIKEYKLFPRYVYAVIKAIDKNIKSGKSISKDFNDPYEAFYWWLSEKSIKSHKELSLFRINYEQIIKETFV